LKSLPVPVLNGRLARSQHVVFRATSAPVTCDFYQHAFARLTRACEDFPRFLSGFRADFAHGDFLKPRLKCVFDRIAMIRRSPFFTLRESKEPSKKRSRSKILLNTCQERATRVSAAHAGTRSFTLIDFARLRLTRSTSARRPTTSRPTTSSRPNTIPRADFLTFIEKCVL
jgi:hypothetical protein